MDTKEPIYCGPNSSFSVGGMLFKPGEPLSKKALSCISSRNLKSYLDDGTLTLKPEKKTTPFISPAPTKKLDTVKKWNVDPVSLVGKSLHQLNIMVLERDPTMTPFETIEEASAQLSKDFKG